VIRRRRRVLLLCSLFLTGVTSFYPVLAACAWHLRHGFGIDCSGRTFQVPLRWTARVSHRTVAFLKTPMTIYSSEPFAAWGSAQPITNPPPTTTEREEVYRKFPDAYRTKLAADQDLVSGPIRTGTGEKLSVCMQAVPRSSQDWLRDTCIVYDDNWSADFQGKETDKQVFFSTILGLLAPRAEAGGKDMIGRSFVPALLIDQGQTQRSSATCRHDHFLQRSRRSRFHIQAKVSSQYFRTI
jgi:hypothetical protein